MGGFNAHTHLYSGLAPLGMPPPNPTPSSFIDILERVWWKLDRALDAQSLAASATYYIAEAKRLGCCGLVDHHESPNFIEGSLDVIADACQAQNMPAVLCYGATERNGGLDEANRGLEECRRFAVENKRNCVRAAVGLHASFTVSDATIVRAAELARELKTVLHVHVAEGAADVEDARNRGYKGVIDRFTQLNAMVPGSVFAHGVHLSEDEIRQVEDATIWLVHNPRSNEGNGVGYAQTLRVSHQVALGTDGYSANMQEEQNALIRLGATYGDGEEVADKRARGSEQLMRDLFARNPPELALSGLAPTAELCHGALPTIQCDDEWDTIRDNAAANAKRLWHRMRDF